MAVVNEELARKMWPEQDPIGKRLKLFSSNLPWLTVIGVTGNVRTEGPEAEFLPEIYAVYTQHPWALWPRHLLVRTHSPNPMSILPTVRQVIHELDPEQPIADVRTLEAVVSEPLGLRNFLTYLLGAFALFAMLLAAIGVYGIMAYSVAQRLREMGIRIALGANQRQVLSPIISDGLRLGTFGIVVGMVGSMGHTSVGKSALWRESDGS